VAGAALQATPKERAGNARTSGAAGGSAAMNVAGFPGQSMVASATGQLYFPMMGDQQCRADSAQLCPADSMTPATAENRMVGMLRHKCDTGKGMSGAPVWVREGTAEAAAAAGVAFSEGLPGGRPDGDRASGGKPAVAVGLVSRHTGDCPWGADCVNLAAPMEARVVSFIRQWATRQVSTEQQGPWDR